MIKAEIIADSINPNALSNFDDLDIVCGFDKSSGWFQYRKMLPNENKTGCDLTEIMAKKPHWISL